MIYRFEAYSLDADRRELRRGPDLVTIEPQVFDVLTYLVCNRSRVVSKDDLIAGVWDGRIVSESTISSRVAAVRRAVGDSGERQSVIRTIPRKGYRFVSAVREDKPAQEEVVRASVSTDREEFVRLKLEQASPSLLDKPSIAVLPFANLSGDPAQEYFVDGVIEDITAALSQFRWLFVIARTSSFAYKGQHVDVRSIGR